MRQSEEKKQKPQKRKQRNAAKKQKLLGKPPKSSAIRQKQPDKQAETAKLTEAQQRQLAEQRQREAEQAQAAERVATAAEREARQNAEAATQTAKQQQQISLARQLAAQADSTRRFRGSLLPTSILLAAEASQRLMQVEQQALIDRGEADGALRNYTLKAPEMTSFQSRCICQSSEL